MHIISLEYLFFDSYPDNLHLNKTLMFAAIEENK